jgi:hypothetical protein
VNDPAKNIAWQEKVTELLNCLLTEMGDSLGYHFEKGILRRNVYFPRGWGENELDQLTLRKAAVDVFTGKKPLHMQVDGAVELANAPYAPQAPSEVLLAPEPKTRATGASD